MSVISTRHTVVPFVSGETKPLSGQRLAKIGYKDRGERKAKYSSIAVSVPILADANIEDAVSRIIPHIRGLFENAQDGIIRSLYESADGTLRNVSDDEICIDACINFLDAERNGSRLTKELIESWFTAEVQDNLSVVIAEKLGFGADGDLNEEQTQVVNKHVKAYKDILSMLAGGRTVLEPKQLQACERAIELASSDNSDVATKLRARIDSIKNPKPLEELLEL
jgi:hypothetical protein